MHAILSHEGDVLETLLKQTLHQRHLASVDKLVEALVHIRYVSGEILLHVAEYVSVRRDVGELRHRNVRVRLAVPATVVNHDRDALEADADVLKHDIFPTTRCGAGD